MNRFIVFVFSFVLIILGVSSVQNATVCKTKQCQCQEITNPKQIPSYKVDCSRNDMQIFPQPEDLPTLLDHLDLSHNSFLNLESNVLFKSTTLRELHLEYNEIKKIASKFFESIPNLEHLDLSHNSITKIEADSFDGLENLLYLNLAANSITTFEFQTFRPMQNLQSLILSFNRIGPKLKEMDIFHETNLGINPHLIGIELENVDIDDVHGAFFDYAINLEKVVLANNPLQQVPKFNASNLTYLDLSKTNIVNLTSNDFNHYNLRTLKLHKLAYLKRIGDNTFYNLTSLENLVLQDCYGLQELNPMAFGPLIENNETVITSLRKLSLARNNLGTLDESYFSLFKQLNYLDLEGNPWVCNCDLLWILNLNRTVHKRQTTRCRFPWTLKNQLIFKLTGKELQCEASISKALLPILGCLVVVLIVLIGYLLYMGPFAVRKYLYVSPESPYQGLTIQTIR